MAENTQAQNNKPQNQSQGPVRNPRIRDPRGGRGFGRRPQQEKRDNSGIDKRMISLRRVAKVNSGSKRLRFSAFVVAGDKKGKVAVGLGRGADTRSALDKATKYASNHLVKIDIVGDTIPHEVQAKYGASKVLLKPAGPGTGVIASSAVRAVMEMAGIRNVLTKQLGSSNSIANAYCAIKALKMLDSKRIMARRAANKTKSIKKDGATKSTKKK